MSLSFPRYLPQALFVVLSVAGACSLQVPDDKDVFSDETAVGGKHTGGKAGNTSSGGADVGGATDGGATDGGTSSTDLGGGAGASGTSTTPIGGIAGANGGGQAGARSGGATSTAGKPAVGGTTPTNGGTSGASGTSVGVGGASGGPSSGGSGAVAGSSNDGGTAGATAGTAGDAGLGGTAGAAGYAGGLVGTGGAVNPFSIGLVHHFKFDGTLADTIDPTKVATLSGSGAAITMGGCKFGSCIQVRQLNGTDVVNLPDGLLSGLDATTISMWVLTLSNSRRGAKAFDFGSGTGTNVFVAPHGTNSATTLTGAELGGSSGGLVFVDLWSDGDLSSSSSLPVWHLFTVTWDATQITFYIDGTSRATKSSPSILPSAITATGNVLGKGVTDTTGMYARFDDLRIYDHVLTQELITGLYTML